MSNTLASAGTILDSEELKELLGAPPVLSSENAAGYDQLLGRLMESMKPKDLMEQLLIKEVVDSQWEMARYVRHKTLSIERQHRDFYESKAKKAKELAQLKHAQANKLVKEEPPTALGRMRELEAIVDETISDVDMILKLPAKELDHARALEKGLQYQLQLDQLYNAAFYRRDQSLEQLEKYRSRSKRRSKEIVDAEFINLEPSTTGASLVPSQDVGR